MSVFQAIVLGLVQGIGEFLPISSSGHLVLTPWLFGWDDPGLAFDVALHFGTLLAVILYFWKDWLKIISLALGKKNSEEKLYNKNILWFLVLATIPGAIAGYLLEDYAETTFRNPLLIAGTLSVVGFILYLVDKASKKNIDLNEVTSKQAFLIGLAQSLAIIPGVSRSGATITAALSLGYDRTSAAKFSFLLSTPIIFGATIMKFDDFLSSTIGINEVVGIAVAFISGYLSIAFLIKFIEKVSYKIFFWYRLILAGLIVILWMIGK